MSAPPSGPEPGPPTRPLLTGELPTFDATLAQPASPEPGLPAGKRIGSYEVRSLLGRGGMGAVYLARRADDVFEKKVAIKVARGALGSPEEVERFKRERQILARLEHPLIARLLDGGATEDGLPYFVMEYVEGRPIHAYCDERRLDSAGRLALFLQVSSAVEYAHRNLIVHRDIKPGNILVTAEGTPRLLDFGIAKLVDHAAGAEPTQATSLAFTPWYASPEQVQGEPMSTATDVYSLGVLLYELLTGHGPYRIATLKPLEVMRAIVEQEPEPPSAAVDRTVRYSSGSGDAQAVLTPWSVSRTRDGTPERLRSRLRGDLDAILMTALRKDPARRYPTVQAFADDIRSHLEKRPVRARRDSVLYRAGKFLRRNRWGVLAAAVVLCAMAAAAVNFVLQSRRVARERDRAERVSRFLVDLFSVSDPGEARGSTVTAREVLDRGAARIETDLKEQPEVRADLMETIADVYDRLGLYDQAARLARESLLFRRQTERRDPAALAATLNLLGNILVDRGELAEAEAAYRESLDRRRRLFGPESREVAESLNNLASVVEPLGRYDEAEKLLLESLALKQKLFGHENQRVATTLMNLGVIRYKKGDLDGSEARFREALAVQRKVLGEDHPEVASTLQSLGVLQDERGWHDEAEKTYREALDLQRKVLGQEHADIVTSLTNLGNALSHAGRLADAEQAYREALPMSRKFYGTDSLDEAAVVVGLSDVERRRGRLAEADALAREAVRIREARLGADHLDTAEALLALGRALLDAGRFPEAEAALLRGLGLLEAKGGLARRRAEAREAVRTLYEKWGRPAEASRFRPRLD
jgi:serine/threonine-protein kinase